MNDQSNQVTTERNAAATTGDAQPQRVSWARRIAALLIAVLADAPPLCLLGESFPVLFDVAVALALWLVLGRSRLLVVALLLECIPGVGLAPTWTAYVLFEIIFSKTKSSSQTISPK